MNDLHVVPNNDLREHETSQDCWCRPVVDQQESGVWLHNSMDRREHTKEKGTLQ